MIKIINSTNLSYTTIGRVIDHYIEEDPEDTLYEGKVDILHFMHREKEYKVQIKYLKRDVVWTFDYANEEDY